VTRGEPEWSPVFRAWVRRGFGMGSGSAYCIGYGVQRERVHGLRHCLISQIRTSVLAGASV
jgi:hypothetical protein